MTLHKLYVYGTLRSGDTETVEVPGRLYDLGWFPGAILDGVGTFKAEIIEIDDARLAELDTYEGYREDDPEHSLYVRRPYLDGWIYEYNCRADPSTFIEGGDWMKHPASRKRA